MKKEPLSPNQNASSSSEDKKLNIVDQTKSNNEYNAFYKTEDGNEVKKVQYHLSISLEIFVSNI